jgi:flavodoxin
MGPRHHHLISESLSIERIFEEILVFCMEVTMEAQNQNNKILIAYFSWSGNAKALAEQIGRETGGDLFEIKIATPYLGTYDECIEVAKQEQKNNTRPALADGVTNMAQYGTVFLCYPNWWGTLLMGVFTFLNVSCGGYNV